MDRPSAAIVALLLASTPAFAEGEKSPMIGGGVIAANADDTAILGVQLEAAAWWGRFGLAAEGSRRWDADGGAPFSTTLGMSARVLLFDHMVGSLFEPRDCELGIELQAIAERSWRPDDKALNDVGAGLALRLRGSGDAEMSTLLAESRIFVRVMTIRNVDEISARMEPPIASHKRDASVMFGLSAVWGSGKPHYMDRFRMHPLDTPITLSP